MEYLKAAIYNLNYEAAFVGAWLYGMKDFIYKDTYMTYVFSIRFPARLFRNVDIGKISELILGKLERFYL